MAVRAWWAVEGTDGIVGTGCVLRSLRVGRCGFRACRLMAYCRVTSGHGAGVCDYSHAPNSIGNVVQNVRGRVTGYVHLVLARRCSINHLMKHVFRHGLVGFHRS